MASRINRVSLASKRAESDNLTILFFMILVLVGCFYAANWFMGGALVDTVSGAFNSKWNALKELSGVEVPKKELPAQCAEGFKCKIPLNESTCPEIELKEYNELCDIK